MITAVICPRASDRFMYCFLSQMSIETNTNTPVLASVASNTIPPCPPGAERFWTIGRDPKTNAPKPGKFNVCLQKLDDAGTHVMFQSKDGKIFTVLKESTSNAHQAVNSSLQQHRVRGSTCPHSLATYYRLL